MYVSRGAPRRRAPACLSTVILVDDRAVDPPRAMIATQCA